jgi:hypothetical protein
VAAHAVLELFDQLEADPEKYVDTEEFVYQDVTYLIAGDDVFDIQDPTRKVGTVDLDEDTISWLSPALEREHNGKRGAHEDEPDVSDSE